MSQEPRADCLWRVSLRSIGYLDDASTLGAMCIHLNVSLHLCRQCFLITGHQFKKDLLLVIIWYTNCIIHLQDEIDSIHQYIKDQSCVTSLLNTLSDTALSKTVQTRPFPSPAKQDIEHFANTVAQSLVGSQSICKSDPSYKRSCPYRSHRSIACMQDFQFCMQKARAHICACHYSSRSIQRAPFPF